MQQISIPAYAKINLTLDIEGKRDDGYHLLSTVFQTISLHDQLSVEPAPKIEVVSDSEKLSDGPENLAYRAAQLILSEAGNASLQPVNPVGGVKINIAKKIPLAAGLAGGSSDAAAVLLGVNHLYGLGFTTAGLMQLALRLGADVPFCLLGGTAWGRGIGEKLSVLSPLPKLWLVLCKPSLEVSTAEVYNNYLESKGKKYSPGLISALERGDLVGIAANMGNALEKVTIGLYPETAEVKQKLLDAGAQKVVMCGSGPTFFAVCEDEARAQQVSLETKKYYRETYVVCTL